MIYDCFTFFNELDLLEIRLNVLANTVDKFVIVEAGETHTGNKKAFIFEENKARYARFLDRIIYLKIETFPEICKTAWARENYQRNFIAEGLKNCREDDTILISDLDEIPNPQAILANIGTPGIVVFDQRYYAFYLNYRSVRQQYWYGTRMLSYKNFTTCFNDVKTIQNEIVPEEINRGTTASKIRGRDLPRKRGGMHIVKNGGWHFTCLGGAAAVLAKMRAVVPHHDFNPNNPELTEEKIASLIRVGKGPALKMNCFSVSIDSSFPEYIRDNISKFQHLIIPCVDNHDLKTTAYRLIRTFQGHLISVFEHFCPKYIHNLLHLIRMRIITPIILVALLLIGCNQKKSSDDIGPVRIAYNYCTLSYTCAYWGRVEWEKELDRLEKAGYNAALLLNGLPAVWQEVLRKSGFSEEEILGFIADDSARAWWHMGNLEGLGGPMTKDQIAADLELGRWLYKEMKRRGIEPMIQGYVGFLPHSALDRFPAIDQGKWCQVYERPAILMPNSTEFAEISSLWYDTLKEVYEMDEWGMPKYLVGDLFHEGGLTGNLTEVELAEVGRSIQARQIEKFGKGVTWVLQAWQMNPAQKALIKGLNTTNTLIEVLDKHMGSADPLTCNLKNAADERLPWVWAEVSNFGGNTGMRGAITRFSSMNVIDEDSKDSFRGYAMLSEGLETNPAMYALFEHNMRKSPGEAMTRDEIYAFLEDFYRVRYGIEVKAIDSAIERLMQSAWVDTSSVPTEGCVENILCAYPAFDLKTRSVSTWGTQTGITYDPSLVKRAAANFFVAANEHQELLNNENFRFDIVELGMQVIANHAREIIEDCAKDAKKRAEFLELIDAAEELAACSDLWRLDYQEARRMGTVPNDSGTVPGYRRMITSWTGDLQSSWESGLHEYAHRAYAGLLKYYYRPRWKWFFRYHEGKISAEEFVRRCAELDKNFPNTCLPPTPRPDLLEVMKKLCLKYYR